MRVRMQNKSHRVTGLHVGAGDVPRYFPRQNSFIELQLGHLQIQCRLEPSFWQNHSEISDPRLCAWLESRYLHTSPNRASILLAMIPTGESSFRLEPPAASAPARSGKQSESPLRAPAGRASAGRAPGGRVPGGFESFEEDSSPSVPLV